MGDPAPGRSLEGLRACERAASNSDVAHGLGGGYERAQGLDAWMKSWTLSCRLLLARHERLQTSESVNSESITLCKAQPQRSVLLAGARIVASAAERAKLPVRARGWNEPEWSSWLNEKGIYATASEFRIGSASCACEASATCKKIFSTIGS